MDRIILAFCLLLAGCGESETEKLKRENQELHEQVDALQTQLATIREKADALETSSSDLQEQMARFQSEDWKDVVPAATQASDDVDSAKDDLKQAADERN